MFVEAWQARASFFDENDQEPDLSEPAESRKNSQSNLNKTGKTGKNSQTTFDADAARKSPPQATSRPLLPLTILLILSDKNYRLSRPSTIGANFILLDQVNPRGFAARITSVLRLKDETHISWDIGPRYSPLDTNLCQPAQVAENLVQESINRGWATQLNHVSPPSAPALWGLFENTDYMKLDTQM